MPNSQPSTSKQEQKESINEQIKPLEEISITLSAIKEEKGKLAQDIQKLEEARAEFSIHSEYRQKKIKRVSK